MNKVYRLVWSYINRCLVPVAEGTSGRGKTGSGSATVGGSSAAAQLVLSPLNRAMGQIHAQLRPVAMVTLLGLGVVVSVPSFADVSKIEDGGTPSFYTNNATEVDGAGETLGFDITGGVNRGQVDADGEDDAYAIWVSMGDVSNLDEGEDATASLTINNAGDITFRQDSNGVDLTIFYPNDTLLGGNAIEISSVGGLDLGLVPDPDPDGGGGGGAGPTCSMRVAGAVQSCVNDDVLDDDAPDSADAGIQNQVEVSRAEVVISNGSSGVIESNRNNGIAIIGFGGEDDNASVAGISAEHEGRDATSLAVLTIRNSGLIESTGAEAIFVGGVSDLSGDAAYHFAAGMYSDTDISVTVHNDGQISGKDGGVVFTGLSSQDADDGDGDLVYSLYAERNVTFRLDNGAYLDGQVTKYDGDGLISSTAGSAFVLSGVHAGYDGEDGNGFASIRIDNRDGSEISSTAANSSAILIGGYGSDEQVGISAGDYVAVRVENSGLVEATTGTSSGVDISNIRSFDDDAYVTVNNNASGDILTGGTAISIYDVQAENQDYGDNEARVFVRNDGDVISTNGQALSIDAIVSDFYMDGSGSDVSNHGSASVSVVNTGVMRGSEASLDDVGVVAISNIRGADDVQVTLNNSGSITNTSTGAVVSIDSVYASDEGNATVEVVNSGSINAAATFEGAYGALKIGDVISNESNATVSVVNTALGTVNGGISVAYVSAGDALGDYSIGDRIETQGSRVLAEVDILNASVISGLNDSSAIAVSNVYSSGDAVVSIISGGESSLSAVAASGVLVSGVYSTDVRLLDDEADSALPDPAYTITSGSNATVTVDNTSNITVSKASENGLLDVVSGGINVHTVSAVSAFETAPSFGAPVGDPPLAPELPTAGLDGEVSVTSAETLAVVDITNSGSITINSTDGAGRIAGISVAPDWNQSNPADEFLSDFYGDGPIVFGEDVAVSAVSVALAGDGSTFNLGDTRAEAVVLSEGSAIQLNVDLSGEDSSEVTLDGIVVDGVNAVAAAQWGENNVALSMGDVVADVVVTNKADIGIDVINTAFDDDGSDISNLRVDASGIRVGNVVAGLLTNDFLLDSFDPSAPLDLLDIVDLNVVDLGEGVDLGIADASAVIFNEGNITIRSTGDDEINAVGIYASQIAAVNVVGEAKVLVDIDNLGDIELIQGTSFDPDNNNYISESVAIGSSSVLGVNKVGEGLASADVNIVNDGKLTADTGVFVAGVVGSNKVGEATAKVDITNRGDVDAGLAGIAVNQVAGVSKVGQEQTTADVLIVNEGDLTVNSNAITVDGVMGVNKVGAGDVASTVSITNSGVLDGDVGLRVNMVDAWSGFGDSGTDIGNGIGDAIAGVTITNTAAMTMTGTGIFVNGVDSSVFVANVSEDLMDVVELPAVDLPDPLPVRDKYTANVLAEVTSTVTVINTANIEAGLNGIDIRGVNASANLRDVFGDLTLGGEDELVVNLAGLEVTSTVSVTNSGDITADDNGIYISGVSASVVDEADLFTYELLGLPDTAVTSSVTVTNSGNITAGEDEDGIFVSEVSGFVNVNLNAGVNDGARTISAGDDGVNITGVLGNNLDGEDQAVAVFLAQNVTINADDDGININDVDQGDVSVLLNGVINSDNGDGVEVDLGGTGDVTITANGDITTWDKNINIEDMYVGDATVVIASGATLTNFRDNPSINKAIEISSVFGNVSVTNNGTLVGRVEIVNDEWDPEDEDKMDLLGVNDLYGFGEDQVTTFTNAGTWRVADRTGNQTPNAFVTDREGAVITNTGTIEVTGDATFLGMTTFNNAGGVIDITHDDGDFSQVDLSFVGSTFDGGEGSTIVIDADLGLAAADGEDDQTLATDSDYIVFSSVDPLTDLPTANGVTINEKTLVVINDVSPTEIGVNSPIGEVAITVHHGADNAPSLDAFALAKPVNKGLWQYDMYGVLDGEDGLSTDYVIASTASHHAFELPVMLTSTQHIWQESTSAMHDRMYELRAKQGADGVALSGGWVKLTGSSLQRDLKDATTLYGKTNTVDNRYTQNVGGLQLGFDHVIARNDDARWQLGLSAGFLQSDTRFKATGTKMEDDVTALGAYVSYVSGGAFVNFALNSTQGDVEYSMSNARLNADGGISFKDNFDAKAAGASLEAGYRFTTPTWFFEPSIRYASTTAKVDDKNFLMTDVDFVNKARSVQTSVSLDTGYQTTWGNLRAEPFFQISWVDLDNNNKVSLTSGGQDPVVLGDVKSKGMLQLGAGVRLFEGKSQYGFVRINHKANSDAKQTTLSGGYKYNW